MARWTVSLALLALSAHIVTGLEWSFNGPQDSLAHVAVKLDGLEAVHLNLKQPMAATSFDDVITTTTTDAGCARRFLENTTSDDAVAAVLGSVRGPCRLQDWLVRAKRNLLFLKLRTVPHAGAPRSHPLSRHNERSLLGLPPAKVAGLQRWLGWDPGYPGSDPGLKIWGSANPLLPPSVQEIDGMELCPSECREKLRDTVSADGSQSFAGGSDPFKSAWPQALARPVSTSSHAYFAIEEDAFALQLATRLSTRSTTSRKIPFAHRARRARRRKKKRGGGAAGC